MKKLSTFETPFEYSDNDFYIRAIRNEYFKEDGTIKLAAFKPYHGVSVTRTNNELYPEAINYMRSNLHGVMAAFEVTVCRTANIFDCPKPTLNVNVNHFELYGSPLKDNLTEDQVLQIIYGMYRCVMNKGKLPTYIGVEQHTTTEDFCINYGVLKSEGDEVSFASSTDALTGTITKSVGCFVIRIEQKPFMLELIVSHNKEFQFILDILCSDNSVQRCLSGTAVELMNAILPRSTQACRDRLTDIMSILRSYL